MTEAFAMIAWEAWPTWVAAFCFGYPFVMAIYWMVGGILFRLIRERHEPLPDDPPVLDDHPPVSILIPCHNESAGIDETLDTLAHLDYPDFEVLAINDGSTDDTAEKLEAARARHPWLRVVHLATNQGKSTGLNAGALAARHEILVCIDGDALLDPHAVTWFVRRFQSDAKLGALTGNPRIRNRGTILGRLQVGEFSTIIGLIKRAQTVYGSLFTISGVICAFRKRALHDAGWWDPATITDDVDVSWRLQLAGWKLAFEPKARTWILMPETLTGLWKQRLRWSQGGTRVVLDHLPALMAWQHRRLWPVWINYMLGLVWAYTLTFSVGCWLVQGVGLFPDANLPAMSMMPEWWGTVLACTYLLQAGISTWLDSRFEKGLPRMLFWIIWYPLAFWLLQAGTAVGGVPKALRQKKGERGVWVSPDRGFR